MSRVFIITLLHQLGTPDHKSQVLAITESLSEAIEACRVLGAQEEPMTVEFLYGGLWVEFGREGMAVTITDMEVGMR